MAKLTFRRVRELGPSEDNAIKLSLFRDESGRVCGWYLGPPRFTPSGIDLPYLAKSTRTLAVVAVMRALAAAADPAQVCIIDPMDLWEPAWSACGPAGTSQV